MESLARLATQVTAVFLAASVALIGPAVAGLGSSIPLGLGLLVLGLGLEVGVRQANRVDGRTNIPVWVGLRTVPLGLVVAALVGLGSLGATPGELQAIGGLCGLLGMSNYFLRPVYGLVAGAIRYLRPPAETGRR
jgi:hypothetical protein